MNNDELKIKISGVLPEAEFSEEGSEYLNVTVTPENLLKTAGLLKDDIDLNFDYMFCLTGTDWMTYLMVAYHLESTTHKHRLVLKVKITDRENPSVETLSLMWKTAEFHEREVYDLLGVKFLHHPDLRRILLEDDWKGFPLRKDYVDEANIVEL
jgi:NADH:ubiquinone oxidoreductase subunit C